MEHHLLLYGPLAEQRPEGPYLDATGNRPALGNIGLEWLIPSGLLLTVCILAMNFLHIHPLLQTVFVVCALTWSFISFSYVHDGFHVKDFWMEGAPVIRRWFIKARDLHEIHHRQVSGEGLMDKNFGIGFSIFDHIFGTHQKDLKPPNLPGYETALLRYSFLHEELPQVETK